MQDLLSELTKARHQAARGATDEALGHIAEALELLADAIDGQTGPKPSTRSIRAYMTDAQFAVKSGDSRRAVAALGSALDALDPTSGDSRPETTKSAAPRPVTKDKPKSLDPNDSNLLRDDLKGRTTEHADPPRLEDEGQSGG